MPRSRASGCAIWRVAAASAPRRRRISWHQPSRGDTPAMIVAIDGPAGSGKSTVAQELARRLGFRYLDTGAMYRALTWLAYRDGVDLEDGAALAALAREQPVSFGADGRVKIAGEDVSTHIRDAEIDRIVPVVARHPEVRAVMRERQ